ncbi:hypothetical protein FJW05_08930 [Mesorhizobium sp. B2-9-1]|nr:hypothetical protein FJW05_08930 [Mesorhizobium sp. B2-9-1]TPJ30401.1 hypothetical protein FJ425_06790 [Mesorhizobium sp. B2-7-2]TPJ79019.1 hypothetical protein FJ419_10890 [Mesorhizobium sp. B2-6-2]TPO08147.1 hypothetical protein FJ980_11505 [Mesorhizobium sp. B1-1-5]
MPLSAALNDADLEFKCLECDHAFKRKGSWFKVISTFKCEGCGAANRIGYADKLALFEKHSAPFG